MTAPALLTEDEAAQALRVCARTLRKARREGRLSYVLIGRAVRYTVRDLETFIESARQEPKPCDQPKVHVVTKRQAGRVIPFTARN